MRFLGEITIFLRITYIIQNYKKRGKYGLYFSYEIRKRKEKMKKNLKRTIGNLAINLGKHAVGKSMFIGMYDPKIPDILKMNRTKSK